MEVTGLAPTQLLIIAGFSVLLLVALVVLKAAVKLTRSCLRVAVVGAVVLLVLAVLAICVMTG